MSFKARTVSAANGVQSTFPVSFPLSPIGGRAEVGVYVRPVTDAHPGTAKVPGTDFNWVSDGQIAFLPGHIPPAGTMVDIRRETKNTALDNTVQSGGSLRSTELVQNDIQLLYLTQEREDEDDDLQAQVDVANARIDSTVSDVEGLQDDLLAEAATRGNADAAIARQLLTAQNGGILPTDQVVITPEAFGAVRYDPLNEVDASDGLQAFFDAFTSDSFARQYIGDWSGEWLVTRTIYMAYWNGEEPNATRRFRMGSLRVPSLARLPGNAPLDPVLDIAGIYMDCQGTTGIHPAGTSQTPADEFNNYYHRTFLTGVRLRFVGSSTFGDFAVDCARRDAVLVDTSDTGGAFTMHGINFPNSSAIGARIGRVFARACGSTYRLSEATPIVSSARAQGYNSGSGNWGAAEGFTVSSAPGSELQRTQITTPSSLAGVQPHDLVWCRVELDATIYGTIAAAAVDAKTGTFTWSAGDPTAFNGASAGLVAGDVYPAFVGGPNANTEFRIVSFGGTSNRTITVTPAPVAHAATADPAYNQQGTKNWHWVTKVVDDTHFTVYPQVADRINSTFHLVTGAGFNGQGGDFANVLVDQVITNFCGVALRLATLYAPKIGTVLGQSACIGLRLGEPFDGVMAGVNIQHGHVGIVDGCDVSILSGSNNIYGTINCQSAFDLDRCWSWGMRIGTNDQRPFDEQLGYLQILHTPGVLHETLHQLPYEGSSYDAYGINNKKQDRRVFAHADSVTLTCSYDRPTARLFPKNHWAEIIWTGPSGAAPTGTLTLNMENTLAALGWTFAGAGSGTAYAIATPGKTVCIKLQFLNTTKKVAITRINGA